MSKILTHSMSALAGGLAVYSSILLFNQKNQAPRPQPPVPSPSLPSSSSPSSPSLPSSPPLLSNPAVRHGIPGTENLVIRESYVLSYDRRLRNPRWVAEHITKEKLHGHAKRDQSEFKEDPVIPEMFRVSSSDYLNSGYDRGHMVPAGNNKSSLAAMNDTFFMTNISPQIGVGFNRHYWSRFEEFCRQLTSVYKDVYVITGPLWLPKPDPSGKFYVRYEVIGKPPTVAVPTHFYKVILADDGGEKFVAAFVMANEAIHDNIPLENFQVRLEHVEKYTGLTFFDRLDRSKLKPLCLTTTCALPSADFWKKNQKSLPAKE